MGLWEGLVNPKEGLHDLGRRVVGGRSRGNSLIRFGKWEEEGRNSKAPNLWQMAGLSQY